MSVASKVRSVQLPGGLDALDTLRVEDPAPDLGDSNAFSNPSRRPIPPKSLRDLLLTWVSEHVCLPRYDALHLTLGSQPRPILPSPMLDGPVNSLMKGNRLKERD